MSSLASIQHRSRQRLQTSFHAVSSVTPILIGGTILTILALFFITSQTTFKCTKYHGDPSLNDVCTYHATSLLGQSTLGWKLFPRFLTGYKYFYPLMYLDSTSVQTTSHYDSETDQTTYSYDIIVNQHQDIAKESIQNGLKAFVNSPKNDYGNDYYTTTTIKNFLFGTKHNYQDADIVVQKLRKVIQQYRNAPKQPIVFQLEETSWLGEIFFIVGAGLLFVSLFWVPTTEIIKLDESTKSLILQRKTLTHTTILTEVIPLSQIIDFKVNSIVTNLTQSTGGPRGMRRFNEHQEVSYEAIMVIKRLENNGAFLEDTTHHRRHQADATAPRGINDGLSQNITGENDDSRRTSQQQEQPSTQTENHGYAQESGEDGEFVLLNTPTSPQSRFESREAPTFTSSPLPTPVNMISPSPQTIEFKLLCNMRFGEGYQGAVGEYVALFKDWVHDFKRRDALVSSERESILKLAEAALQRQAGFAHNDGNSSSSNSASNEGRVLSDEEVNFLLRRRNARLVNDESNNNIAENSLSVNNIAPPQQQPSNLTPTSNNSTCCVCLDEDAPVRAVLMPCKHLIMCNQCAAACDRCPLCRRQIAYTMEVFF